MIRRRRSPWPRSPTRRGAATAARLQPVTVTARRLCETQPHHGAEWREPTAEDPRRRLRTRPTGTSAHREHGAPGQMPASPFPRRRLWSRRGASYERRGCQRGDRRADGGNVAPGRGVYPRSKGRGPQPLVVVHAHPRRGTEPAERSGRAAPTGDVSRETARSGSAGAAGSERRPPGEAIESGGQLVRPVISNGRALAGRGEGRTPVVRRREASDSAAGLCVGAPEPEIRGRYVVRSIIAAWSGPTSAGRGANRHPAGRRTTVPSGGIPPVEAIACGLQGRSAPGRSASGGGRSDPRGPPERCWMVECSIVISHWNGR
jgi:hypothetical protein